MPFLNNIDKLNAKILELEERIEKLSSQDNLIKKSGVTIYNKQLANCHILTRKTIDIINLYNPGKNQIYIQLKIKFYNYSPQNIQFKLFLDKILISQETNYYTNNSCEIVLSGVYQNNTSDNINIQLQAISKEEKQFTLIDSTLTVWGNSIEDKLNEYDAIESNNSIFLSYIKNSQLYYKIFDKNIDSEDVDFIYLDDAISHSICNLNNTLYLFRVDPSGNLFYYKLLDKNEIFISSNVSKVTCCGTNSEIIFAYISNGQAFYGEIFNNIVISNKQIKSLLGFFINCHIKFNAYNNKCYLLLTKNDSSNYLLESISNNFCSSENICADISLHISTS